MCHGLSCHASHTWCFLCCCFTWIYCLPSSWVVYYNCNYVFSYLGVYWFWLWAYNGNMKAMQFVCDVSQGVSLWGQHREIVKRHDTRRWWIRRKLRLVGGFYSILVEVKWCFVTAIKSTNLMFQYISYIGKLQFQLSSWMGWEGVGCLLAGWVLWVVGQT